MTNLAGVVQQLRRERDQAAKTVERLDAALEALNGVSRGKSTELAAACQRQHGRGSLLPSVRDGRGHGEMGGRNRTWSQCPRGKTCPPPLVGRSPQL